MRVGTLAYATQQGLGILAKAFSDNGVVTDTMVVRHSSRETLPWYPGAPQWKRDDAADFLASCDVALFFETPFDWQLIDSCRDAEVLTALMVMHECTPAKLPAYPDVFLCPSLLDMELCLAPHMKGQSASCELFRTYPAVGGKLCVHAPVPVEATWKLRTHVKTYVHNAGHGGLKGRNGTAELVEALKYTDSDFKLILRSQKSLPPISDRRVDVRVGDAPYAALFAEGDAFVFPEKFNGLSLPLQEAFASGMAVLATDRFPMNAWLPNAPLIRPLGYRESRVGPAYAPFQQALIDPRTIAEKLDAYFCADVTQLSREGALWAEGMSWSELREQYLEVLAG